MSKIRGQGPTDRTGTRTDLADTHKGTHKGTHNGIHKGTHNGTHTDLAHSGAGMGLVGLGERVELAGGRVAYGPTGDHFRLEAWLPWPDREQS